VEGDKQVIEANSPPIHPASGEIAPEHYKRYYRRHNKAFTI
jgi:hypothetical protein